MIPIGRRAYQSLSSRAECVGKRVHRRTQSKDLVFPDGGGTARGFSSSVEIPAHVEISG
jgi:hypothetical protein